MSILNVPQVVEWNVEKQVTQVLFFSSVFRAWMRMVSKGLSANRGSERTSGCRRLSISRVRFLWALVRGTPLPLPIRLVAVCLAIDDGATVSGPLADSRDGSFSCKADKARPMSAIPPPICSRIFLLKRRRCAFEYGDTEDTSLSMKASCLHRCFSFLLRPDSALAGASRISWPDVEASASSEASGTANGFLASRCGVTRVLR